MDLIEKRKRRKQIITIALAFGVALPCLIYFYFIRPNLGGGGPPTVAKKPAQQAAKETKPASQPSQPGFPVAGAASGAGAGQPAAAPPLPAGTEPFLPYRNDPFGLVAAPLPSVAPSSEEVERFRLAAVFGPGTWGVVEREATAVATTSGGGGAAGGTRPARAPRLTPVTIPALNVAGRRVPPLPSSTPGFEYQSSPLPTSVEVLAAATVETPTLLPPELEGMRLAGIVRTGYPRGILEWKTAQGTLASQVISPNQPITWPQGSRVERLGSDYAIIRDAQGRTWRVPLRW